MISTVTKERRRISPCTAFDAACRNDHSEVFPGSVLLFGILSGGYLFAGDAQRLRECADIDVGILGHQHPISVLEPDFPQDRPAVRRAGEFTGSGHAASQGFPVSEGEGNPVPIEQPTRSLVCRTFPAQQFLRDIGESEHASGCFEEEAL